MIRLITYSHTSVSKIKTLYCLTYLRSVLFWYCFIVYQLLLILPYASLLQAMLDLHFNVHFKVF